MIYGTTFYKEDSSIRHTYNDWGLLQVGPAIVSPPKVQTYYIKVPGRDGSLDYTTALDGNVHYESREFVTTLKCVSGRESLKDMYHTLLNYLHGRKARAVCDDDPRFYWEGRFEVDEPKWNKKGYWTIDITGQVDPYKYSISTSEGDWLWDPFVFETDIAWDYANIEVNDVQEVVVVASGMPTTPIFTLTAPMTVKVGGAEYEMPEGKSTIPGLILTDTEKTFVFVGDGEVTIGFRGGSL